MSQNELVAKIEALNEWEAIIEDAKAELAQAKAMSTATADEKAIRKAAIEISKNKISAIKAVKKHYADGKNFVQPDYAKLEESYEREDAFSAELKALNNEIVDMKKSGSGDVEAAKAKAAHLKVCFNNAKKETKALQDEFANFNRAAKPYLDARKLLTQAENYTHYDEISAKYDIAKARYEESVRVAAEEKAAKEAAEKAHAAELRAQRKNKKK